MAPPANPASLLETERLAALYSFDILDTPPEGAFDNVCALTARFFKTPIALISLVDEDRIWFKSKSAWRLRKSRALPVSAPPPSSTAPPTLSKMPSTTHAL